MSKKLHAEIIFMTQQEGGCSRMPVPGIRPQIAASDVLTSCIVHAADNRAAFEVGIPHEVVLEVPFWDQYREKFHDGMAVELHDGSRIIARGKFLQPLHG